MILPRSPFLRRALLAITLLIALGGGYYLLRYQAWGAYRDWRIARMNGLARDFLAADDPRNALLTVRKVLRQRPNDVEAWRIGVAAAEKRGTAEVVQFQRNLRRLENTPANTLELMRLALQYRVYPTALEAAETAGAGLRDVTEFHRLAAEAYRGLHRDVPARAHLLSLLSLAPGDPAARLALAEIELDAGPGARPADWAQRVRELVREADAATGLRATLLLLREALERGAVAEVEGLARPLADRADLGLTAQLQVIEARQTYDAAAAEQRLADVQRRAAGTPADVARVMAWLARRGQSAAITAWYDTLPEAARQDPAVKLATAQALEQLGRWPALADLLRGPRWPANEVLRQALLARAARQTGRTADFAESWKLALIAAGANLRAATLLWQKVEDWHWPEERADVLWKIFNLKPTHRGIRDELIRHEFLAGHTVNLNKIYARIVAAEPGDDEARNNFAYTSLLLGNNRGRAQLLARDLFQRHPENPAYLTTYTLALHLQGRSEEALTLLEESGTGVRGTPSVMLHESICAAAAGRPERAAELLPQLVLVRMLPEERQLADTSLAAVARASAHTSRQALLAALPEDAAGGWLALLPEPPQPVTPELKLADAYYRRKDMSALMEILQAGSWREQEYLRCALLAYGERQQGREGAALAAWRQAFAAAGRDARLLQGLEALTRGWEWTDERMEVLSRRFERDAANSALLAELVGYYRRQARTPDLVRTLWSYVNETTTTGTEAAWCVYYSLLCDMNVAAAHTLARRIYTAAPQDPRHRVAYAFALWRQQRADEGWKLVAGVDVAAAGGMQVTLVEAATLLDLGRKQEAQAALSRFAAAEAMPEEIRLAETLEHRLNAKASDTAVAFGLPAAAR